MPPIQKILFGSPGIGKSYQIREIAQQELDIEWNEQTQLENIIQTVFHPEYTYSDFVGKLFSINHYFVKVLDSLILKKLIIFTKNLLKT
jgi:hypothetical protein